MKRLLFACLLLLALSITPAFAQNGDPQTPDQICADATPASEPETRQFDQPEQVLEPGVDYRAVFCTDVGAIYVDLLEAYAPATVNNFVFLSQQGYYNNTTFHRVMQDFMAQGGDPTATGTGGPGYTIPDEIVGFLYFDQPGWLAMANIGQPHTAGSQFFITTVPYPSLNFGYTIFGKVLEGQDNVAAIKLRDPDTATEPGTALNTVVIITDPTSVETTYEPPAPVTRDDIAATIEQLNQALPDDVSINEDITGTFDSAQVVAIAPDNLQSDFAAFLDEHHHEFRAGHGIVNSTCDLQTTPFMAVGYTLDRFATPDDTTAALNDDFIGKLAEANGFTASTVDGLDYPLYTQSVNVCDTDAISAMTVWQRGHYLVTASVVFPNDGRAPAEVWLKSLVGITLYESWFSDALRAELP